MATLAEQYISKKKRVGQENKKDVPTQDDAGFLGVPKRRDRKQEVDIGDTKSDLIGTPKVRKQEVGDKGIQAPATTPPVDDRQLLGVPKARTTPTIETKQFDQQQVQPREEMRMEERPGITTDVPTVEQQRDFTQKVREAAVQQSERERNLYLQDLERQQQLQQRRLDEAKMQKDRGIEIIDRQIEDAKLKTGQQIDDIVRQTKRSIDASEKYAALQGYGRSTGYIQGLDNVRSDSERTINRIQETFDRMQMVKGEQKAELMQKYNTYVEQAKEDLDYRMRSLKENAEINMNALIQDLDLDPDIVDRELEKIDLDIVNGYNKIISDYTSNIVKQNEMAQNELVFLQDQEERSLQMQESFSKQIEQYGLNMNVLDIQSAFENGQISFEMAKGLQNKLVNGTIATIDQASGIVGLGTQFYDQISQNIEDGMSPNQIIGEVLQSEEYKAKLPQEEKKEPKLTYTKIKLKDGTDAIATYDNDGNKWVVTNPNPGEIEVNTTDLVSGFEGFRTNAYQDSAGVWTIGYGATQIDGVPVQPGDTITQEKAKELLATDIARHQNYRNFIQVPLTPAQDAALNSFEFNLGSGIWKKNAMPIIDAVNEGNLQEAARIMKLYNRAGGKYIQGLQNRRNKEVDLLLQTSKKAPEEQVTMQAIEPLKTKLALFPNLSKDEAARFGDAIETIGQTGDKDALYELFSTAYFSGLSSGEQKTFNNREQFSTTLNNIKNTMTQFVDEGGDVGFFTGKKESILRKIGKTKDPRLASLASDMLDYLDLLARDRTGAALTTDEERFYKRLTPGIEKGYELNMALIDSAIGRLERDGSLYIDNKLRKKLGKDYDLIDVGVGTETVPEVQDTLELDILADVDRITGTNLGTGNGDIDLSGW